MGNESRVRKYKKVKSSPGIVDGKRGSNESFDSIEESPNRDDSFWREIDQNMKKNIDSELQSEIFIDGSIKSESINDEEEEEEEEQEETDDPIFSSIKPSSNSSNSSLSSKLPFSSSDTSLSERLPSSSDLSSRLPSPSSSYSSSTNIGISDFSLDKLYEDLKNGVLVQLKELDNGFEDEELTIPFRDLTLFISLMQSPSIQVMDRSGGGYDPQRIPAAIFETISSTPVDWSDDSTESLFSLNLGRSNSFMRDQILSRKERIKSGGGENRLLTISTSDDTNDNQPSTVVEENEVKGVVDGEVDCNDAGKTNKVEQANDQDIKDKNHDYISIASLKYNNVAAASIPSVIVSNPSIGSGDNSGSFAFPVLADGTKTIDPTRSSYKTELVEQPLHSLQSSQPLQMPGAPIILKEAASRSWFNCFSCGLCCCSYHPCSNCSCHISSSSSCFACSCSPCFPSSCHMCSCSSFFRWFSWSSSQKK